MGAEQKRKEVEREACDEDASVSKWILRGAYLWRAVVAKPQEETCSMQCNVLMEGGVARTTLEKLYFALGAVGDGWRGYYGELQTGGIPIWFSTNQRANCLEGPSPFLLRRLTRTV